MNKIKLSKKVVKRLEETLAQDEKEIKIEMLQKKAEVGKLFTNFTDGGGMKNDNVCTDVATIDLMQWNCLNEVAKKYERISDIRELACEDRKEIGKILITIDGYRDKWDKTDANLSGLKYLPAKAFIKSAFCLILFNVFYMFFLLITCKDVSFEIKNEYISKLSALYFNEYIKPLSNNIAAMLNNSKYFSKAIAS